MSSTQIVDVYFLKTSNRMSLCNRVNSARAKSIHWQYLQQMSHLSPSSRSQKICLQVLPHQRPREAAILSPLAEGSHWGVETYFQLSFPDLHVLASCIQQLENITEAASQEGVPKTCSSFRWQWQKTTIAPWGQPPALYWQTTLQNYNFRSCQQGSWGLYSLFRVIQC